MNNLITRQDPYIPQLGVSRMSPKHPWSPVVEGSGAVSGGWKRLGVMGVLGGMTCVDLGREGGGPCFGLGSVLL